MRKKLFVVFTVVAVLGLAGCRNDDSTDAPEATVTVVPTKEAEPTTMPEPVATSTPEPTNIAEEEVTSSSLEEAKPTDAKDPASIFEYVIEDDGTVTIHGLIDESLAEVCIP